MTVKDCYGKMNGSYDEIISRLMSDDRIKKFLFKFLNGDNFSQLSDAMEAKNYEEAFKAVHTLKGVSANMAFTSLTQGCEKLTEDLRGGQASEAAQTYFEEIKASYELVIKTIKELQEQEG